MNDTRSVSPDADELQRAFEQYGSQLVVHSDTSYNLAPEVFTRAGAVAIAALLLIPLAGFAARRRWAAYVVGGSLAVFAVMLVPFLFTSLADLVSISQARRAAGFLPFAFAFAGGMGVLARLVGPLLLPLALGVGMFLQIVYPGDFDYVLREPAPAWIAWFAVLGAVAALVVGFVRRRPALETGASLAAAAFLIPVVGGGLLDWKRPDPPEIATLTPGLVGAVRDEVEAGTIVYSDSETSFRARGASRPSTSPSRRPATSPTPRRTARTSAPRTRAASSGRATSRSRARYGAEYVVVDGASLGARARSPGRLRGRAVHGLPRSSADVPQPPPPGVSMRRRSPGFEVEVRDRGKLLAVQEAPPGQAVLAAPRAARRERAALGEEREAARLEDAQLADDAVAAAVAPGSARSAPELVALDAERVRELERLGRRVERVRHRDVDARRPVRVRAGALAAADRLVVREAVVSEDGVVHRALALRGHGDRLRERVEDDVGDPARRLRVPRSDGGRRARVDERALGRAHASPARTRRPTPGGRVRSGSARRRSTPSA